MANPQSTESFQDVSANKGLTIKRKPDTLDNDNEIQLKKFRSEPLDENIDYISLKSSLSLLKSRIQTIKRDVSDLSNFKKRIKYTDDIKELVRLIKKDSNYLNEINYKGCCVKAPYINWENSVGIDLEKLNDESEYQKINENYEIIKRDKLFN